MYIKYEFQLEGEEMLAHNRQKETFVLRLLNKIIWLLFFIILGLGVGLLLINFWGSTFNTYLTSSEDNLQQFSTEIQFECETENTSLQEKDTGSETASSSNLIDYWTSGQNSFKEGKWEKAVDELTNALDQYPENDQVYLYLAIAYRQLDDDASAEKILKLGLKRVESESLQNLLKAVEVTRDMPQQQVELVDSIYKAISTGDQVSLISVMEQWWAIQHDSESMDEWIYFKDLVLVWDGKRFCDTYDGTGMILYKDQAYYGDISGVLPHGHGILIKPSSVQYMDSVWKIEYVQIECDWSMGIAINHFVLQKINKQDDNAILNQSFILEGILDNSIDEIFLTAEGYFKFTYPYGEKICWHAFPVIIKEGVLQLDTMNQVFESYVIPCTLHSDCECEVIFSQEDMNALYYNVCRWSESVSPKDMLDFLNPTISYSVFLK